MAAAARRARLEESWAWVELELQDYDAQPEQRQSAAGNMALEPLYDAVDSIVARNPTLEFRRSVISKMVTQLVERVGSNPTSSAILDAADHLEATLVQEHRIGVADATPTARRSFHRNDGSRRFVSPRSDTPNGISGSLRSVPSFSGTDRSATPDGVLPGEAHLDSPVTPAAESPRSPTAALAEDPLCTIEFDGLAASDDELVTHCCDMAQRLGMHDALGVGPEKIREYFLSCREQMHSYCPFHNWHHVADVTQCLYTVLLTTGLNTALTIEQLIAVFLAAPAHDLDHRGRSNILEINEETDIAKEFPDEKGPLENHHARLALETLENTCILDNLSETKRRVVRACVKNGILATDMGRHGAIMNGFKESIADLENKENSLRAADFFIPGEKGWLMLGMLLKACDVSNPSRPIPIADKWNDLVYQEFYTEGDIDRERGRPVNPLHDKTSNNIPKSTVGFIGFVVCPIYMTIQSFLKACCTEHANTEKPTEGVHSAQKASRREAVNAKVGTGSSFHKVLRPQGLQVFIDSLESNKAVHNDRSSEQAATTSAPVQPTLGSTSKFVRHTMKRQT